MIIKEKLMSFLKVIVKIAMQGKFVLRHMVKHGHVWARLILIVFFNAISILHKLWTPFKQETVAYD